MVNLTVYLTVFCLITVSHGTSETEVKLKGKVAVVTGGAKGIGYAIADNCLNNGIKVIIVDKNLTRGLETEAEFKIKYGDNIWFIHGDVTTDLDRVFKTIFKVVKYVHILVNNAGIIDEYDPVTTMNTNAMAPVLWSQKFYEVMREDKGGVGGTIMNIASVVGYYREPFFWYYKASKFAVLGLSFGMGHELNHMRSKVRVFAICPSFTYTDMTKQQMVVAEYVEIFAKFREVLPWQSADSVGKAAVTLLKTATTGMAYTVQNGTLSVSPDSVNVTAEFLLSL